MSIKLEINIHFYQKAQIRQYSNIPIYVHCHSSNGLDLNLGNVLVGLSTKILQMPYTIQLNHFSLYCHIQQRSHTAAAKTILIQLCTIHWQTEIMIPLFTSKLEYSLRDITAQHKDAQKLLIFYSSAAVPRASQPRAQVLPISLLGEQGTLLTLIQTNHTPHVNLNTLDYSFNI